MNVVFSLVTFSFVSPLVSFKWLDYPVMTWGPKTSIANLLWNINDSLILNLAIYVNPNPHPRPLPASRDPRRLGILILNLIWRVIHFTADHAQQAIWRANLVLLSPTRQNISTWKNLARVAAEEQHGLGLWNFAEESGSDSKEIAKQFVQNHRTRNPSFPSEVCLQTICFCHRRSQGTGYLKIQRPTRRKEGLAKSVSWKTS